MLAVQDTPTNLEENAVAAPLSSGRRVLLIDDEEWLRELVGIALREKGFEVMEAADGAAGIEIALKERPDLILCDVRMDGVTGYDVLSRLRHEPLTVAIPFILMTGKDDSAGTGMRQGMELGADDYLRKPFSLEELYAALDIRLKKAEMIRTEAERKLTALRDNITLMLPHELRTPLNGILAYGDILNGEAATLQPDEIAEMGQIISESGRRLERLVENFIIYTQTELLGTDPERTAALRSNVCTTAREVAESRSRKQAEEANRLNDLDLELQSVSLPMSEEYLAKVVDELVRNAFKFSEPETPVSVCLAECGGVVQLVVSDLGRGLSPEQVAQIGAFMQFDRKSVEQQGLGLGLTIARRLTELHRGELQVQSEPGQGTRVVVKLPV